MTTKQKTPSKPAATEPLEIAENQKAAAAAWKIPLAVLKAAKAAGCTAFKSGRVHRAEFFEWLAKHEETAAEAEALDLKKAEKAELEKERLRAQIVLLRSRNDRETRTTIPMEEAREETARALAILQEEFKALMDPALYRAACIKAKARTGEVFPD